MKKIRIVFIVHQINQGGMESALFNLISLMDKDKFDITIFSVIGWGEWEDKFRDSGFYLIDQYARLREPTGFFSKLSNIIKIKMIDIIKKINCKQLLSVSSTKKFDIVVSYQVYSPYGGIGFPRKAKTIKYVHGNVASNAHYRLMQQQLKYENEKYDRIICVSDDAKKAFINLTGRTDNILTLFNPINGDNILKRSEEDFDLRISAKTDYICAVGRLSPEKGFERLVNVFNRLISDGIKSKLVIVGDGVERNKLTNLAELLGLTEYIELIGHKDNPYPYIRNSLFTVLPSFTEGLPVVAMESLCLGIPIVSTYPSAGELFGEEICGIITENDDDSLYQGMKAMLTDTEFYKKLKKGAENRSCFFKGATMVREVEKVFIELYNESEKHTGSQINI